METTANNHQDFERASFWHRGIGLVVDKFLSDLPKSVLGIITVIFALNGVLEKGGFSPSITIIGLAGLAIVCWNSIYLVSATGRSLGKRYAGTLVLDSEHRYLTWRRAAARELCKILSVIPLGLGYLWMFWDENGQTWHDKIVKTNVYYSKHRSVDGA